MDQVYFEQYPHLFSEQLHGVLLEVIQFTPNLFFIWREE